MVHISMVKLWLAKPWLILVRTVLKLRSLNVNLHLHVKLHDMQEKNCWLNCVHDLANRGNEIVIVCTF